MKLLVVFMCCVVLSATAYPQSRTTSKSKNKPKLSRQELAPATPTPVAVSTNTSTVLTIATNSTPSVIVSTETPKAGGSTAVPQPTSVPTTAGIASTKAPSVAPTTVAPPAANATTTRPEEDDDDEEDEDDNETSEEIDEDIDDQDEEGPEGPEGDLLGAPPGAPQPFEEDNASFEGDDDDQEEEEERAADEVYSNINNGPIGNNKVVDQSEAKVRETSGGIDAYVPGYVTDQGEVLVPIDTLERGLQYTIISDRYVSIPQKKVSKKQQNPVYLYRQETTLVKGNTDAEESSEEETPEVIPVKISETSVIFATKAPAANDSLKEEIGAPGATSQSSESVEDEDEQTKAPESEAEVKQVPLGAIPANRPTGEDDEDEVVGLRRANVYRRNFYPNSHLNYRAHFDYMNNVYDNRRLDYPVAADPYSSNFYRSYGSPRREQHFRFNGPYSEGPYSNEDSLEDFGRSDFYDYY